MRSKGREKHDWTKSIQLILRLFVCFMMQQLYLWLHLRRHKLNYTYGHLEKSPRKALGRLPKLDERRSNRAVGYFVVEFVMVGGEGEWREGVDGKGEGLGLQRSSPGKLQG